MRDHCRGFALGHGFFARHDPRRGRAPFVLGFGRSGGGRSSIGRYFAQGDLRLVILHLIAESPRHGYDITRAIEDKLAGAYSLSPGVIYPTLTLLAEMGLVTISRCESGKKLHINTEEGGAYLEARRAALDALLDRMDETHRRHGGGPAPQIVRAMENLRMALQLRLGRGPLSDAEVAAITAAIDAAAAGVERA